MEDLDGPSTSEHAKQLAVKSDTLDSDFKSYHFQIIDLLEGEQEALNRHDDPIAEMNRLNRLYSSATLTSSKDEEDRRLLDCKLSYMVGHVTSTKAMIDALPEDGKELDPSLLELTEV